MPVETIVTEAGARGLFDTGDTLDDAAFTGLIDYVGRKSVVEVLDVMTTAEITASLTDDGVAADAIWTKALEKVGSGGAIRFPAGRFNFTSTIHLNRRLWIAGQAWPQQNGNFDSRTTELHFAADTTGFVVHRYDTDADTVASNGNTTTASRGDGSIFERLHIVGGGGTQGHGIYMRARATIEKCRISGFGGNGINIVADTSTDTALYGNANGWVVRDTYSIGNAGHGMYIDGGDSNSGYASAVNCASNDRSGIYDSSFLGNTYVACHTATNGSLARVSHLGRWYHATEHVDSTTAPAPGMNWQAGDPWDDKSEGGVNSTYPAWESGTAYEYNSGYVSDGDSSRNVFIGCYSESNQATGNFTANDIAIGGLLAAGTRNCFRLDGTECRSSILFTERADDTVAGVRTTVRASKDQFIGFLTEDDHPAGVSVRVNGANNYAFVHANLAGRTGLAFKSDASTETYGGNASRITSGTAQFPIGYVLGSGNRARKVSQGDTPPDDAFSGDIHYYATHTAGGWIGAACVTSATGDPLSGAVWKNFGAIEA